MNRVVLGAVVLVGVGLAGIVTPLAFPPDDVYKHDTSKAFGEPDNRTMVQNMLDSENATVIAYPDVSDRGQQIYRDALATGPAENYRTDRPAPDWSYDDTWYVIIERPNGTDLPPADEATGDFRYDMMGVGTGSPPYTSIPWVVRLVATAIGVVCLTAGGYLFFERR